MLPSSQFGAKKHPHARAARTPFSFARRLVAPPAAAALWLFLGSLLGSFLVLTFFAPPHAGQWLVHSESLTAISAHENANLNDGSGRRDSHVRAWGLRNLICASAGASANGIGTELDAGAQEAPRIRVLGIVGIITGFDSGSRRESLRKTWMASSPEALTHLAFLGEMLRLFDADFYVKADDDIYLRPDRLSVLLGRKRNSERVYIGCMKKGPVVNDPALKWYEPDGYMLGSEYFLHAYGPIYALSQQVVASLVVAKSGSLRMFINEDVSVGAWMLAFNVTYEDNRLLCEPECRPNSIAVWDIPRCSGLCNAPSRLLELHDQKICSASST